MVVLDRRLRSKRYGDTFIRSLPPCDLRELPLRDLGAEARVWLARPIPPSDRERRAPRDRGRRCGVARYWLGAVAESVGYDAINTADAAASLVGRLRAEPALRARIIERDGRRSGHRLPAARPAQGRVDDRVRRDAARGSAAAGQAWPPRRSSSATCATPARRLPTAPTPDQHGSRSISGSGWATAAAVGRVAMRARRRRVDGAQALIAPLLGGVDEFLLEVLHRLLAALHRLPAPSLAAGDDHVGDEEVRERVAEAATAAICAIAAWCWSEPPLRKPASSIPVTNAKNTGNVRHRHSGRARAVDAPRVAAPSGGVAALCDRVFCRGRCLFSHQLARRSCALPVPAHVRCGLAFSCGHGRDAARCCSGPGEAVLAGKLKR